MNLSEVMLLQEMKDQLHKLSDRITILEEHVIPVTKEPLICPKCGAQQFIQYKTSNVTMSGTHRINYKQCHNCQYQIMEKVNE